MNEEGWGLREFLGFIVAIFFAIFITMVMYNRSFDDLFDSSVKSDDETYQDLESDLAKVAHTYTDNFYHKRLENGDNDYVTVKELQDEELIRHVVDVEDDKTYCSGYVNFYRENGTTTYDSYIKCADNYETDGYNSKYDEKLK